MQIWAGYENHEEVVYMNAGTGAALSILLLFLLSLLAMLIHLYTKVKIQEIKIDNINSKLNSFIIKNSTNVEKINQNYTKTDIFCPEYVDLLAKQALKEDKMVK